MLLQWKPHFRFWTTFFLGRHSSGRCCSVAESSSLHQEVVSESPALLSNCAVCALGLYSVTNHRGERGLHDKMDFVSDDLSHVELTKTALSVFKVVNELSSHAHQAGWIRHIFKLHSTCYKLIRTSILRSICVSIILSFSVMGKYLASQFLEWFLR